MMTRATHLASSRSCLFFSLTSNHRSNCHAYLSENNSGVIIASIRSSGIHRCASFSRAVSQRLRRLARRCARRASVRRLCSCLAMRARIAASAAASFALRAALRSCARFADRSSRRFSAAARILSSIVISRALLADHSAAYCLRSVARPRLNCPRAVSKSPLLLGTGRRFSASGNPFKTPMASASREYTLPGMGMASGPLS
jgi:hypothetical protein